MQTIFAKIKQQSDLAAGQPSELYYRLNVHCHPAVMETNDKAYVDGQMVVMQLDALDNYRKRKEKIESIEAICKSLL